MKKILVIGESGFVGGHVAQAMLADGYPVRCLARNPAKIQKLADAGCEIVPGDMLDPASLQRALASVDAGSTRPGFSGLLSKKEKPVAGIMALPKKAFRFVPLPT